MNWPPLDTLKAFVVYGCAAFIVVAGMGAIYGLHNDPTASDTVAIFAGFVGGATAFLFGQEIQQRTAKQSQTATAQGVQHGVGNGIHPEGPIDETPPKA